MQMMIGASVFFAISTLALCTGFLAIKKSEKKIHIASWLPATIIGLMGYHTMIAAIINLLSIPVNIISIGIANLIPAIVCWIIVIKKKQYQKYIIEWVDICVWALLIYIVAKFAYIKYGPNLFLNFNSIDASVHLNSAMYVVNAQKVNTMFFSALNNGLFIELLGPFVSRTAYFKVFTLAELCYLFLAGAMFFGVIRKYCKDTFLKIAGCFATVAYVSAYPLSSTQYGFSYLGLCITVIAFVIFVTDEYACGEINKTINIILLSLGCVGVFQAYVLFMPVVYFSVLFCVLMKQHLDKKLFSVNTIITGLGIFLLPTAIGLWYTYRGIFATGGSGGSGKPTVSSQIALEGGIYADLFSNFVMIAPLALFALWMFIKNKENKHLAFLLPLDILFVLVLFVFALDRKVSAYYFYKNYYMLWLLVCAMAFIGVSYLDKQSRIITVFGALISVALIMMARSNYDTRIQEKNPLLHPRTQMISYADIYIYNRDLLYIPKYSTDKVELYRYINEELYGKNVTQEDVYIISDYLDQYWYEAIIGRYLPKYTADEVVEKVDNGELEYLLILKYNPGHDQYGGYLDKYERIYETPAGYILKLE